MCELAGDEWITETDTDDSELSDASRLEMCKIASEWLASRGFALRVIDCNSTDSEMYWLVEYK